MTGVDVSSHYSRMEVNQTSLFVSCDTSRFCPLVTRVAPFIHGFKSSRFAVYLVMTREIYRACHFLSFPCMESCFHFLRLQNRSCTTSVSHQTYYTNINLFSSTSLGLYFFFFQEVIQTCQRVCDITDGICVNVKNVCIHDRSR